MPWIERVGVELVEIGNAHGEEGVGKQLDRLGLGSGSVNSVGMSCLMAQSASISANARARSDRSPTTMREG
jgi:hypothetical protein